MRRPTTNDERRPSARFCPAAAEPLLVVDSPRPRSRSGSRANVNAVGDATNASDKTAAVAPAVGEGGVPVPKRSPSRDGVPVEEGEEEVPQGLLASLRSYPKGVFFMLGNEFCERFSFYGMRAVLIMYFIYQHNFETSTAKFLYHGFVSLAYLSPLFGSIAADNYFGRFRVILWVSLLYVLGHGLLSVGAVPYLTPTVQSSFDFSGLILIALATGGIKPCVSAFAADQFNEHQHYQRGQFFSFFYFSINAGSLVAIMLTPLLRGRVSCFGSPYCFPLAFGVPGVLMLVAFFIFLSGWRFYKITPAGKGNVVWKVVKCIGCALKGKLSAVLKRQDKAVHWVDYASPKYSDSLIAGVKSLLAVSLLFVPVVFFWALFDQQGSTWVLQASQMDGRVGPFIILPDQMNVFNPLIVLLMVPVFEAFIYPFVRKFVAITPLRKMGAGGVLAALAFVMAGFLQLQVNGTLEPAPALNHVIVQRLGPPLPLHLNASVSLIDGKNELPAALYELQLEGHKRHLDLRRPGEAFVLGVFERSNGADVSTTLVPYKLDKASNGQTNLLLLVDDESPLRGTSLLVLDDKGHVCVDTVLEPNHTVHIQPAILSTQGYVIHYGPNCSPFNVSKCDNALDFRAETGAVHALLLHQDASQTQLRQIVQANRVSVLWQLPQFFVITLGEVLFSVTGLEFSYSQAAPNMKSVLQALWLLTTFFGNVIDMSISGARMIEDPALEFFFYAFLMFIVIGVFILIAVNYQYVDEEAMESEAEPPVSEQEKKQIESDSAC